MKTSDVISALKGKFTRVETPHLVATYEGGLKYYLVKVYDLAATGAALRDQNIPFYVKDEGKETEVAYWGSSGEPKPAAKPDVSFSSGLRKFIQDAIAAGQIKAAFVDLEDEGTARAVVNAVMADGTKLVERRVFVFKDGTAFKYQVIG